MINFIIIIMNIIIYHFLRQCVLAVILLVASASAAPWGVYSGLNAGVYSGLNAYTGLNAGVIPYTGLNAGLLPYAHRAVAPVAVNAVPIDGGYPYTDALGFSTGLTNVGARVPLTYGAVGAYAHHLPISTTVVKA